MVIEVKIVVTLGGGWVERLLWQFHTLIWVRVSVCVHLEQLTRLYTQGLYVLHGMWIVTPLKHF